MLPIVYFVFLISCSALAANESEALSVWWESEMPSHSETSHRWTVDYGKGLAKVRPNIITCCVCKEVIRKAKIAVSQKIQQKTNKVCYKYIEAFRKTCFQNAGKVRDIILNKIFSRSPAAKCSQLKLC